MSSHAIYHSNQDTSKSEGAAINNRPVAGAGRCGRRPRECGNLRLVPVLVPISVTDPGKVPLGGWGTAWDRRVGVALWGRRRPGNSVLPKFSPSTT